MQHILVYYTAELAPIWVPTGGFFAYRWHYNRTHNHKYNPFAAPYSRDKFAFLAPLGCLFVLAACGVGVGTVLRRTVSYKKGAQMIIDSTGC